MQSLNEDIIAGATAGAVGRVLTAPLDVIKIRHDKINLVNLVIVTQLL